MAAARNRAIDRTGRGIGTIWRINDTLIVSNPAAIGDTVAGHLTGRAPLDGGLDLYYALEQSTSLIEFHTMLRPGPRNLTRDGLQQSYGDHNRLLMLALDRLLAGDLDWLRDHVAPGTTVDEDLLRRCAERAGALDLPSEVQVALWLGAGLHDCGMLRGQGAHVDVEDGLALAAPLLDTYCPAGTRPVAEYALRHHDYVKDSFLGEAPVGALTEDLDRLDAAQRPLALAALGLIQVAGASSLGVGRLTEFRVAIFHECLDDTAFADPSVVRRLARLLAPSADPVPSAVAAPDPAAAATAREALTDADRADLDALLESVFVHGWHGFVADAGPGDRIHALVTLARHNRTWGADHVVLSDPVRELGPAGLAAPPEVVPYVALSGARTVTVVA